MFVANGRKLNIKENKTKMDDYMNIACEIIFTQILKKENQNT